jgi:alkanesulfonate monooxygenase SsuD/methylene tetrahydromethanopterin reductase-like flavin-dependent oxidoreductase (luciferase family)
VYERFATLDALSSGRAEIILGRGSFTESFPLFGFDLGQYEELFEEKLDLFSLLLAENAVTWKGRTRAPLTNQQVYPKTESGRIKTWIGVGGSPESVIRAAKHGMGVMLAIIGGEPVRFVPFVELYQRACAEFRTPILPIGVHSPGYIADTDRAAADELWPHYEGMRNRIGGERGWGVATRREFDQEVAVGSMYCGSPETVAQKIAATVRVLGIGRFDMKYSAGTLPHSLMMRSIELYGTKVIPRVRELLA